MYAEERQQATARLVGEHGRLSVAAIAEQFGVTTETVRRDLSSLERMGLVRRVHGGAVPASSLAVIESGLGERDQANTAEKELIAHCRAAIAAYKVPKAVEVRSEPLPKSGAGKTLKRELRAPFWAGRESMVSGA